MGCGHCAFSTSIEFIQTKVPAARAQLGKSGIKLQYKVSRLEVSRGSFWNASNETRPFRERATHGDDGGVCVASTVIDTRGGTHMCSRIVHIMHSCLRTSGYSQRSCVHGYVWRGARSLLKVSLPFRATFVLWITLT